VLLASLLAKRGASSSFPLVIATALPNLQDILPRVSMVSEPCLVNLDWVYNARLGDLFDLTFESLPSKVSCHVERSAACQDSRSLAGSHHWRQIRDIWCAYTEMPDRRRH
jgi:hypothetical protein